MSKILRRGRLKPTKTDILKFTSSIKSDEKIIGQVLDINKAHIIMLMEEKIIEPTVGAKILEALKNLEGKVKLNLSHEDVHMAIEEKVIESVGLDVGGNIHIGKSRNDQVATALRMRLREELIRIMDLTLDLQRSILEAAKKNLEVIIPGYTHLQPAQPIRYSHYLISFFDALNRDLKRLIDAYERVNRCPMGAGALATTSFSINRKRMADLLGFNGLIENSIDAVSSRDFALEVMAAISIMAVNISRYVEDMILWSTLEFNMLELPDEYSSTSSIMPQKKNPEVLEVIRARVSHVIGNLLSALTIMKSLPTGYNLDMQELTPKLWETVETTLNSISILRDLIRKIKVNREVYRRSFLSFTTSTELANTLTRKYKIPFRAAHNIVGASVKRLIEDGKSLSDLTPEIISEVSERMLGRKVEVSMEDLESTVNPEGFVESHKTVGGPSRIEVERMINSRVNVLDEMEKQISKLRDNLKRCEEELNEIVDSYLNREAIT